MNFISANGDLAFTGLIVLIVCIIIPGYVTLFQSRYKLKKENDYLREYIRTKLKRR